MEALVNSRSPTEVSSDSGLEAITLDHFLISRADPVLPCGVFSDKEILSKKRWRHNQVVVNQVWSRWLKEYLPALIERKKGKLPSHNPGAIIRDGDRKSWDARGPMIWDNFSIFRTNCAILTSYIRADPRTCRGLSRGFCHVV